MERQCLTKFYNKKANKINLDSEEKTVSNLDESDIKKK